MNKQENNHFNNYELSDTILNALKVLGYQTPTEIQKLVIPIMLSGANVLSKAPTGSGKTAAFAIPVCENVVWEENLPQVLILEPTRELTEQVRDEVFFIGRLKRLKVAAVYGGFPIDKQIQTLKQKSHIIVGTPGRVMDHIRRGTLKLSRVKWVVIDEADLMLDMGFADEVKEILAEVPENAGISLFSATLKPEICRLTEGFMQEAITVSCDAQQEEEPAIEQKMYETEPDDKYDTFIRALKLENPESAIIFCGTREMVNVLFQKLRRNRIFCGMLHGDMEQKERLKTVNAFRRGGFRYLIATDVAARGIDFKDITHVFNYDFPTGRETYVHRIGRTGRNGKTGTAVSLVCEEDRRMLKMVEEFTGQTFEIGKCPEVEEAAEKRFWASQRAKTEVKTQNGSGFTKEIMRLSIGGGRKSKIRANDIVATICSIEGVEVTDIGIIDIRDSLSYVEILNRKGALVLEALQNKTLKGKVRKVKSVRAPGMI